MVNNTNGMLRDIIIRHEGLKLKPYVDTVGKLTIGVGRNLTDCGISVDEAYAFLEHDLTRCELELIKYSWYSNLDEVRKGVMIELVFNMGLTKLLGFKNMISALKIFNYEGASTELLDSKWAKQVGYRRSSNIANRLLEGQYY